MLEKLQVFNAESNDLPLKAAGAVVGAALGAILVAVVLSLVESEELLDESFASYAPPIEEPVE